MKKQQNGNVFDAMKYIMRVRKVNVANLPLLVCNPSSSNSILHLIWLGLVEES